MYCPKCNTPNPAFNKKCSACGEHLPKLKTTDRDPGPLLFFGIAASILSCFILYSVISREVNKPFEILGFAITAAIFCFSRYIKLKRMQKKLVMI